MKSQLNLESIFPPSLLFKLSTQLTTTSLTVGSLLLFLLFLRRKQNRNVTRALERERANREGEKKKPLACVLLEFDEFP